MFGDPANLSPPFRAEAIARDPDARGFAMASDARTGALLRALAAAKPAGRLLELGTGTGLSAAWLLDGMDEKARLLTVELDPALGAIARRHLGDDPRVEIRIADALEVVTGEREASYDLVFADSLPGKFEGLDAALDLVAPGGLYVIDDMLPQASWPENHAPRVEALLDRLAGRAEFARVDLTWSSGIVVLVRRPGARGGTFGP
jgi:predicted O-methyltransferase YrrM